MIIELLDLNWLPFGGLRGLVPDQANQDILGTVLLHFGHGLLFTHPCPASLSVFLWLILEEKSTGFRLKPPTLIHGQAPSAGKRHLFARPVKSNSIK